MNYDSKHQALKYHRELFSSLYDVEVDKTSYSEYDRQAQTLRLTATQGCDTLETRGCLKTSRVGGEGANHLPVTQAL